jgi:hypothetical protein
MKKLTIRALVAIGAVLLFQPVFSQIKTNTAVLRQAATLQAEKEKLLYERLQKLSAEKGWEMVITRPGYTAILIGVDDAGLPLYLATENNIASAATIGTNKLWPGGSTGLNLSGSSNSVKDKLAIWDGGKVQDTHVELVGRVIQKDGSLAISDHATHVAGTMIASGVNPSAKGMSNGLQRLVAYDFGDHLSEILLESPNLLVSNHSYGIVAGWTFSSNRWEFRGRFGDNEDYKFGYYSSDAQLLDSVAYNAPFYLIVKSSGNNRDVNGPAEGQPYWRYNASGVMSDAGNRPPGISNNDSYDIISTYGVAKNILTVGAIGAINGGYNQASDAVMSSFSSWGPADDGRIKPDVVADGVDVVSSLGSNTSTNSYAAFSGTSMATPAVSGSLLLLQEYYNQLHAPNFMRAATLKGLAIHTANEAGDAQGPDYKFGWGVVNMEKAAAVITSDNTTQRVHQIRENVLNNGATFSLPVIASGNGTLSATISWTDPKAPVVEPVATALNNPAKKLVNDLDIVIKKGATTFRPWILNPGNRDAAATRGDNTLDNVEKIELPDVVPGETYTIEITHKSTLERGSQAYSLIVSGAGGQAVCASGPTSSAGARIDSVSFASIRNKNAAGCTTYSNFTNLLATVEPGQALPFFARLNSCDATSVDKIVKVFIDANNDGDFSDPDETLATSAVINGNGDFSGNITIPVGMSRGQYTILRVVMQETNTAANVNGCGSYTRGETQDYRVVLTTPANDVTVSELVAPNPSDCSIGAQFVTVRIANLGSQVKSGIPVRVVVKQGTTTIATLNATYPGTLAPGASTEYTFQTTVNLLAGTTYTFTSSTLLLGDQAPSNDQIVTTVAIRANSSDPVGSATICGTATTLKATPVADNIFTWYTSATSNTAIASGTNTTTNVTANPYYLMKNNVATHLGPTDKMAFTTGSYLTLQETDQQLRAIFSTTGPLTIETARMYLDVPGRLRVRLARINNFNYSTGAVDGFFVSDHFIDAYATSPTTHPAGQDVNDPADAGAIFRLGIDVPEAGTWALIMGGTGGGAVYRNRTITTTNYPYSIPGVITLEGNGAVTTPANPTYFQGFYYFFYDIAVKLPNCPSNRVAIVPTTATAPTITQAGSTFSTTAIGVYQWLLNGTPIAAATQSSYTATIDGTYSLQVTDANGCTLTSNSIVFSVTAVPNVDPAQIGLVVSPVPARGSFEMKLRTTTKSDLNISLISTNGQRVYNTTIPDFIGSLTKSINTSKMAAGVYYLQINHDKKMYIRKMVIIE